MKFKVTLIHELDLPAGGGSQINFYHLGLVHADSVDEALGSEKVSELRGILADVPTGRGAPGRKVIVRDVDDKVHQQWVDGKGPDLPPTLPKNFHPSYLCTDGQQFDSALKCSQHLGFNHNEISVALNRVAGEPDLDDRRAWVRGVQVQYLDDAINARPD